jgi:hypothetical protein
MEGPDLDVILDRPALGAPEPGPPAAMPDDWYANLVGLLVQDDMKRLAQELDEEVAAAEAARKPWREIYSQGLKKLGIDRTELQRSIPFPGASAVRHPLLLQAAVEFQSRAMSELSPPGGPCRGTIVGAPSEDLEEKAARVAAFQNWQLTDQVEEFSVELDRLLMMLPLEGSSFAKLWYDPSYRRPRFAYVPAEAVVMPYGAVDEQTAPFVAQQLDLFPTEIRANIASGLWVPHAHEAGAAPLPSASTEVIDQAQGQDRSSAGDTPGQGMRRYWEIQARRVIPGIDGDQEVEWLITLAADSQEVVAIRRNWRAADARRRRIKRLFHWRLFPWAGAYGVGFLHMIGGLADAATGSLRALMDSAVISNLGGGFTLKRSAAGTARERGPIMRRPGEYAEIDAPGVDDIRRVVMPDPFQGPSEVLFQLLGALVDTGTSFASVAMQELAEASGNVPVGTTLARIEEGSRVFAQIFSRLHRTFGLVLRELHEVNRENVTDQWIGETFVAPEIQAADFDARIDVVVVSDPRTFSYVQRQMQGQLSLDLVRQAAEVGVECDMRAAYASAARQMGLQNADELFPEKEPFNGPAAIENAIVFEAPLKTAQQDNHLEHTMYHLSLLQLPGFGRSSPGQRLITHVLEHGAAVAMQAGVDAYLQIVRGLQKAFEPEDQGLARMAQAEMAKVDAKREEIAAKLQAQLTLEREERDAKLAIVRAELDAKLIEIKAELQANREANASKERIASAQIAERIATAPPPTPAKPPAAED